MTTRNCPYCNTEMKLGYQFNYTHPIQWIPIDKKYPIFRGRVAKGGVRTGEGNLIKGYEAKSFYCENCKIIVTPVKPER